MDAMANFQDAGQICNSCKDFWDNQGLPPKHMVHVFNDEGIELTTDAKSIEIIVCPYCDGDRILKLRKD